MSREYSSNQELQNKILEGVNKLTNNVASTLGPLGRNVILHQKGKNPIITKDGVTVAKFVDLSDPFENAAFAEMSDDAHTMEHGGGYGGGGGHMGGGYGGGGGHMMGGGGGGGYGGGMMRRMQDGDVSVPINVAS